MPWRCVPARCSLTTGPPPPHPHPHTPTHTTTNPRPRLQAGLQPTAIEVLSVQRVSHRRPSPVQALLRAVSALGLSAWRLPGATEPSITDVAALGAEAELEWLADGSAEREQRWAAALAASSADVTSAEERLASDGTYVEAAEEEQAWETSGRRLQVRRAGGCGAVLAAACRHQPQRCDA